MAQSASSGVLQDGAAAVGHAPGGGGMARNGGAERLRRELREIKTGVRDCSRGLHLLTLQLNLIETRVLDDRRRGEGIGGLAAPLVMMLLLFLMYYLYVPLYEQASGADHL